MGTKYATILVGGVVQTYNDNPPADDGSQTEANRIKFATVTSDLTAPLHSAIISMDDKLVDHVDEGPTAISGNTTTTADQHNQVLEHTGTGTISLLNPSGNVGYQVTIKNAGTDTATLQVDGGANIDGVSSLSLSPGQARKVYVNAAGSAYYSAAIGVGSDFISVVQALDTAYTTYGSATTQIPKDNTIPQNTEGDEIITQAITPKSATNRLRIECYFPVVTSDGLTTITMALFQDATADALAVAAIKADTATRALKLEHEMAAGTTSATTFKIRLGPSTAQTIYINGSTTARLYGGISAVRLRITEYST